MSYGTTAPRAVLVLSLLLTSLTAAILLGGYVFRLDRWIYLWGSVALIPAGVSGIFNPAFSRLPR